MRDGGSATCAARSRRTAKCSPHSATPSSTHSPAKNQPPGSATSVQASRRHCADQPATAGDAVIGSFDVLIVRTEHRTNEIMKVLTLASTVAPRRPDRRRDGHERQLQRKHLHPLLHLLDRRRRDFPDRRRHTRRSPSKAMDLATPPRSAVRVGRFLGAGDRWLGDQISNQILRHHRRRLRRLGWGTHSMLRPAGGRRRASAARGERWTC